MTSRNIELNSEQERESETGFRTGWVVQLKINTFWVVTRNNKIYWRCNWCGYKTRLSWFSNLVLVYHCILRSVSVIVLILYLFQANRFGGHCVTFYCITDLFTQHPQFTDGLGKKLWEDKMTSWENHIFVKTFANWTKANLKKWQKI